MKAQRHPRRPVFVSPAPRSWTTMALAAILSGRIHPAIL